MRRTVTFCQVVLLLLVPMLSYSQARLTPSDPLREPLEVLPNFGTSETPPLEGPDPTLGSSLPSDADKSNCFRGRTQLPTFAPPPSPGLRERRKFFIKRIHLFGNTVFTNAELAVCTDYYVPSEGGEISTADLQELRFDITRFYVAQGYVNSGAVIPRQSECPGEANPEAPLDDGEVCLEIIEGKLTEIRTTGNIHLRDSYLADHIWPDQDVPLNLEHLRERLQLLQQDPLVAQINAELSPGLLPGQGVLQVKVIEGPQTRFGFLVGNDRSPSVGGEQYKPFLSLRNITGYGDSLDLAWGITTGGNDVTVLYQLPLNGRGTRLQLGFQKSGAETVESPFEALDIQSDLESYEVGLFHPFILTPERRFTVGASLALRTSNTELLGFGFPFSLGVQNNGASHVTVLRLSQDYVQRGLNQVLAMRSTFNFGVDAFGATTNDLHIDGIYTGWLGQFQWVRRFEGGAEVVVRGDMQFTKDGLLPLEKFSIGGLTSVRGYRESLLVRDSGYVGSVEFRYPVANLAIPGLSQAPGDGQLQVAVFADYGRGWNEDLETPDPKDIGSVGVGLRYNAGPQMQGELYWGYALLDVELPEDEDIQDHGLHFLLRISNF